VRVLGERKLIEFAEEHSNAKSPLRSWRTAVASGSWKNPAELRRTFGSVSFVGKNTVFNIGGNKFRLISVIDYDLQTVLVTHVLTHKDYDKGGWE
jgi:mRNA interferase HigB